MIKVCLELTDITEIFVNSTFVRWGNGALISGPFCEHTRSIAVVLHYFGQDDIIDTIGMLADDNIIQVVAIHHGRRISPILFVATYLTVSGMLPGHE